MDLVNKLLGWGPSGRSVLFQAGLLVGSAGAVIQALTLATSCAHAEWSVSAARSATVGKAVLWGQMLGALTWSAVADCFGRKEACCLSCVVTAAATAACGLAASFELLEISSGAAGFGLAGMALGPVLLVIERAPATSRGRCVVGLGLFATAGAAATVGVHAALEATATFRELSPRPGWRTLCGIVALLPFGTGILASNRLAESIPWLASRGRLSSARLEAEKAATRNARPGSRRVAETLGALDKFLTALDQQPPQPQSCLSAAGAWAWTSLSNACRAAAVCGDGLAFLVAFGFFAVVSLVRLELDGNDEVRTSAFRGGERRLSSESKDCSGLDYSVVWSALASELVATAVAAHLVDAIGRRPTLAGLCAAAAGGVLCLCAPEYFPQTLAAAALPGRTALLAAMMTARATLAAAAHVVSLLVAETRPTHDRAAALAAAYVLAKLGGFLATFWVVSPNPLATIALLVTLVDVSAAWAALAFPIEPANKHCDALVPADLVDSTGPRPISRASRQPAYRLVGQIDLDDLPALVADSATQRNTKPSSEKTWLLATARP